MSTLANWRDFVNFTRSHTGDEACAPMCAVRDEEWKQDSMA